MWRTTGNAGIDSNGNGDTAGDRASVNPFTSGQVGSDVFAVCELPNGTAGPSNRGPGNFTTPTGIAACGTCFDPSDPTGNTTLPAIGYKPLNPNAKYVITGPGARANLGRNSFKSPGFGVLSLTVAKNFHFTEGKSLQVKADVFNVLNHANYALSNGNVFNATGISTARTTPGYAVPTDANFLNAFQLFGGGIRSMTLGLKLYF